MVSKKVSTYYFIGRLSPPRLCQYFHPGELHLGNGFVLEVFQELIAIWIAGTRKDFGKVRPLTTEAFEIAVTTFMFLTGLKLDFQISNWVEAKGVIARKNILGYIAPAGTKLMSPSIKGKYSIAWRKVAKYYLRIEKSFYHRMALKDYKNCINAVGDDAFFYAFRIIEDIRRAATSHLPEGLKKQQYWNEMHHILGTSEKKIKPLTNASTKVRHGAFKNRSLTYARKNKEKIINIAVDAMKKEFRRSFKGLVK